MSSQIGNEHQMLWIFASIFFFQLNLVLFSCFRSKKSKHKAAPTASICENVCDSTGRPKKQKSKEKQRKCFNGYTFRKKKKADSSDSNSRFGSKDFSTLSKEIVSKEPLRPVKQERKSLTDDNQYENLFMLQQADQANEGKATIEKQSAANMGVKNSVEPILPLDNSNERSKDTGKNVVDQKNIIGQPADVVKTIVPVPPVACVRSDDVTPFPVGSKDPTIPRCVGSTKVKTAMVKTYLPDASSDASLATFLRIHPNENQNSIDEEDQEEDIGLLAEEDDTQPDWTVKSSKKQHKGQKVKHK